MYLGLWAVGASHSTATLSSGGPRGLYGLRLVHRLNISLSCFGPRAGQATYFLSLRFSNPNPIASHVALSHRNWKYDLIFAFTQPSFVHLAALGLPQVRVLQGPLLNQSTGWESQSIY